MIQTSEYETWGLTINESLASGISNLYNSWEYHELLKIKTQVKYIKGNIKELNLKMKNLLIKLQNK